MHIYQGGNSNMFCYIFRLLVVRWSLEEYFKAHSANYRKLLKIFHLGRLVVYEETLGMAHVC